MKSTLQTFFKDKKIFLKYLCSYICILFITISGLYLIVQFDLKNRINEMYVNEMQERLNHMANLMDTHFVSLSHINHLVQEDLVTEREGVTTDGYYNYMIKKTWTSIFSPLRFSLTLYVSIHKEIAYIPFSPICMTEIHFPFHLRPPLLLPFPWNKSIPKKMHFYFFRLVPILFCSLSRNKSSRLLISYSE